jgi:two-component system, chemotaxis family, sensor kinase CheA
VSSVIATVAENTSGELPRIESIPKDETRDIALAFNAMAHVLDKNMAQENELKEKLREENWLKTNFAEITTSYQGAQNLKMFAEMLISKLTPMVGACYGVFYFIDEQETAFKQLAAYAENKEKVETDTIKIGEGLIGQCALENKILDFNSIPNDSIKITSGLISATPKTLLILPIEFEGRVTTLN